MYNFIQAPELKDLVTFVPNKIEPIHNWYWYKEGYSKKLVDYFIKKFSINKESVVLDPFCGVGTTLLACKQAGINSIGFDVNPLCVFVSKVKTANYDLEELESVVHSALKWKFKKPEKIPQDKRIARAFSKWALQDLVFLRENIMQVEDEKARNFLLLALIDSSIKSSFIYKDGAFVKIVKKKHIPMNKIFDWKIRRMLKDLKEARLSEVEPKIEIGDARNINIEDDSVDFVITSPPYLNKIEYTNIYGVELSLFFNLPETKLRSYISDRTENVKMNISDIPIVNAYFDDMKRVLEELYRVCKEGSKLSIVIGGGCFPDRVIQPDEILSGIAEEIGFSIEEILIARNIWCTKAKTIKIGKVRESAVILKK